MKSAAAKWKKFWEYLGLYVSRVNSREMQNVFPLATIL